jgi:uncharacterized phage-associated protein
MNEKLKPFETTDIAAYVIAYSLSNDIEITHFKIQKLLYYIQAWYLVYFNKNLIFKEPPQAWVNGPVYRSVYNLLKDTAKPHKALKMKNSSPEENIKTFIGLKYNLKLSEEQEGFLNSIMNHYGIMTHEKLIYLTHKEKPWNEAREGLGNFEYSERPISFETMYEFYNNFSKK